MTKNPNAKALGSLGGHARAKSAGWTKIDPARRQEMARKAALARWACPFPIDGDKSRQECLANGHCGCGHRVRKLKPTGD